MTVGDRRLARLLNAFPEIVVVLDALGNVLWANDLAIELFGRSLAKQVAASNAGAHVVRNARTVTVIRPWNFCVIVENLLRIKWV